MCLRQMLFELAINDGILWMVSQIITKVEMPGNFWMIFLIHVNMMSMVCITSFTKVMSPRNTLLSFTKVALLCHWIDEVDYGCNILHHNQNINNWFGINAGDGGAAKMVNSDKDGLKDGR